MGGVWQGVAPLLAAILGAVLGGFVVHLLTSRREAVGVRRAQRIDYLIAAYRRLIRASNRPRLTRKYVNDLESAFADIMLLGEKDEISAAHAFMVEFTETLDGSLDPVIGALRRSLRDEIGLEAQELPKPYNLRLVLNEET